MTLAIKIRYRCHNCGSGNVFTDYDPDTFPHWYLKCTSCGRVYPKEHELEDEIKIQDAQRQIRHQQLHDHSRMGGLQTTLRYSKKQRQEWGRRGGRPRLHRQYATSKSQLTNKEAIAACPQTLKALKKLLKESRGELVAALPGEGRYGR